MPHRPDEVEQKEVQPVGYVPKIGADVEQDAEAISARGEGDRRFLPIRSGSGSVIPETPESRRERLRSMFDDNTEVS